MLASVTAGTTLSVAGALTVRMARRRAELPLALIPLLFGLQQLTEGAVWWSLDHDDAKVNVVSTIVYTLFARVLWPFFVPFAMRCLEVVAPRRTILSVLLVVGGATGLEGLSTVLRGPDVSQVCGSSIQYQMPSLLVVGFYLTATCGGALASSHRVLRVLGAAALGLGLLTLWLYTTVFVSLWCFFSAVLTVVIFGWFRARSSPRQRFV